MENVAACEYVAACAARTAMLRFIKRRPYEADAALERLLITLANQRDMLATGLVTEKSPLLQAVSAPRADAIFQKFGEELVKKYGSPAAGAAAEVRAALINGMSYTLDAERGMLRVHCAVQCPPVPLVDHAALFARARDEQAVRTTILRYAALMPAGQQWGLPRAVYAELREKYGVQYEAFASPINSRLMRLGLKDGKPAYFGSLYGDEASGKTDAPFGSLGMFTPSVMADGIPHAVPAWCVNPPYIESVMDEAVRTVAVALASAYNRSLLVFFIVPAWLDSAAYLALHASSHLLVELHLPEERHAYENPAGERIVARFGSVWFALGSDGCRVDPAALHADMTRLMLTN